MTKTEHQKAAFEPLPEWVALALIHKTALAHPARFPPKAFGFEAFPMNSVKTAVPHNAARQER